MFSFLRRWLKTKPGQRALLAWWILFSIVSILSTVMEDSSLLSVLEFFLAAIVLIPVLGFLTVIVPHYCFSAFREWMQRRRTALRFLCPACLHFWDYHFACKGCGHKISSLQIKTGGLWDDQCFHCGQKLFSYSLTSESQIQLVCDNCQQSSELHIHYQRRVRVLATLHADDFAELCRTARLSQKHSLYTDPGKHNWYLTPLSFVIGKENLPRGMKFACQDDGERLTYILLSDEWKPEKFVALQHALRHVESIWLNAANTNPLKLGQAVDRFLRHSDLTEAQRRNIGVCVPQSKLDPLIRNRLEAWLGRISYNIEPAKFLGLRIIAQPALADSSTAPESAADFSSARREHEFQER